MRLSFVVVAVGLVAAACAGEGGTDDAGPEPPVSTAASAVTESAAPATTSSSEVSTASAPADLPGLEAGDHEISISHDGIDRRYFVHVPPGIDAAPAPMIIALHGGGGTAAQLKSDIGMDTIADREGFVAVYPDGTGLLPDLLHTWNGGFNCCGPAQRNNIDDVGFIRTVVADLAEKMAIDLDRVAVTGHSNGGIMAYRVAAEASDLVTVAVPVAGAMAVDDFGPASPVAILHIHSVDDPRALYDGGEGPVFPGTNSTVFHEPVVAGLAAWAAVNGCDSEPTAIDSAAAGDQSLVRLEYQNCVDDGRLVHLRLAGVGHGWPGVTSGREGLLGPATALVDASEEVWAFASEVWDG